MGTNQEDKLRCPSEYPQWVKDKDDWNQKKSICYVFSDVFSRTPNQEFAQNVLAKLYSDYVHKLNIDTGVCT